MIVAIVLILGFIVSSGEDRKIGALFLVFIATLGFFAAFVDLVHVVVGGTFFASNMILGVIEEGGEMLTSALALAASLLLCRHLDGLRRSAQSF